MSTFNFLGMKSDHSIKWLSLIWAFLPLIAKLAYDYVEIVKKKREPDHKKEVFWIIPVVLIFAAAIWMNEPVHWFQPIVLILGILAVFFDPFLNLLRGEKITYIDQGLDGKSSWWDRQMNAIGVSGMLFVKFWIALASFAVYFFWSYTGW